MKDDYENGYRQATREIYHILRIKAAFTNRPKTAKIYQGLAYEVSQFKPPTCPLEQN